MQPFFCGMKWEEFMGPVLSALWNILWGMLVSVLFIFALLVSLKRNSGLFLNEKIIKAALSLASLLLPVFPVKGGTGISPFLVVTLIVLGIITKKNILEHLEQLKQHVEPLAPPWHYNKKRYPSSYGPDGKPRPRINNVQLNSIDEEREEIEEEVRLLSSTTL